MNPDNLPSNTEYAYAHLYQPHPYLFTQTGFEIEPIRPMTRTIMKIQNPSYEPEKRKNDSPSPKRRRKTEKRVEPDSPKYKKKSKTRSDSSNSPKRRVGRPCKPKKPCECEK